MSNNKIRIGNHKVTAHELYVRITEKLPKDQFAEIIKEIEEDLNQEHGGK